MAFIPRIPVGVLPVRLLHFGALWMVLLPRKNTNHSFSPKQTYLRHGPHRAQPFSAHRPEWQPRLDPPRASGSDPFSHHGHTRDRGFAGVFRSSVQAHWRSFPGGYYYYSLGPTMILIIGPLAKNHRQPQRCEIGHRTKEHTADSLKQEYLPNGPRGNVTGPSSG